MSLWMPYAEQALDLSRVVEIAETIKQERLSPPTVPDAFPSGRYQYGCHSPGSLQQYPYNVPIEPVPQLSPEARPWSVSSYTKSITPPGTPDFYESESLSDDVEYQAFERDALRAMADRNGGSLLGNNPRMRRAVQGSAGDDAYRKQRERNNQAAKQSRDRRKLREVRLAFQVTFLRKKLTGLRARLSERVCARCQQQCRC